MADTEAAGQKDTVCRGEASGRGPERQARLSGSLTRGQALSPSGSVSETWSREEGHCHLESFAGENEWTD